MGSRKRRPSLLAIIYIVIFTFFCLSGPEHEADASVAPLFGSVRVQLSGGLFPRDAEALTTAVEPEDLAMLEHFTELSAADLRGSGCYEDIRRWSAERPEISVLYSVPLPDGTTVDSDADRLDLSGLRHSDVEAASAALACLPALKTVELGQVGKEGEGLTLGDLSFLRKAMPQAGFDFSLTLLGQEIYPDETSLDLSGLGHGDAADAAAVLSCMSGVETLTLGKEGGGDPLSWEDLRLICDACPEARVDYEFSIYGKTCNLKDSKLDLRGVAVGDGGAALRKALPCMNGCKTLDMDSTGLSDAVMAKLREDFPETEVIWRVWFGENYSVRTDAERILASKPTVGGMIYDASVLQYCTKVKYLDLGHNDELYDLSFAASMPDLEVLIIAMTGITDISPLKNCTKINYLELNSTNIGDISVLSGMKGLRDLNIAECPNITDISSLYDIPMDRLWIGCHTPAPEAQTAKMRSAQPDCDVNTTAAEPHGDCWRYYRYDPEEPKYYWVERYELIREQLGYNYQEYSFYWLDPLCELEAPAEFAGMYGREVYGLE